MQIPRNRMLFITKSEDLYKMWVIYGRLNLVCLFPHGANGGTYTNIYSKKFPLVLISEYFPNQWTICTCMCSVSCWIFMGILKLFIHAALDLDYVLPCDCSVFVAIINSLCCGEHKKPQYKERVLL